MNLCLKALKRKRRRKINHWKNSINHSNAIKRAEQNPRGKYNANVTEGGVFALPYGRISKKQERKLFFSEDLKKLKFIKCFGKNSIPEVLFLPKIVLEKLLLLGTRDLSIVKSIQQVEGNDTLYNKRTTLDANESKKMPKEWFPKYQNKEHLQLMNLNSAKKRHKRTYFSEYLNFTLNENEINTKPNLKENKNHDSSSKTAKNHGNSYNVNSNSVNFGDITVVDDSNWDSSGQWDFDASENWQKGHWESNLIPDITDRNNNSEHSIWEGTSQPQVEERVTIKSTKNLNWEIPFLNQPDKTVSEAENNCGCWNTTDYGGNLEVECRCYKWTKPMPQLDKRVQRM